MTLTALLKLYLRGTVTVETPGQDPRARVRRGQPAPGGTGHLERGGQTGDRAWMCRPVPGRSVACQGQEEGRRPLWSWHVWAPHSGLQQPGRGPTSRPEAPRALRTLLSLHPPPGGSFPLPVSPTGIFMCSLRTSPVLLGDDSLPPFVIWENLTYVSILMLTTIRYLIF